MDKKGVKSQISSRRSATSLEAKRVKGKLTSVKSKQSVNVNINLQRKRGGGVKKPNGSDQSPYAPTQSPSIPYEMSRGGYTNIANPTNVVNPTFNIYSHPYEPTLFNPRTPQSGSLGINTTVPLTNVSNILGQPPANLHNSEFNLPTVQAFPLPPYIPLQQTDPAYIKQNAGKYIPSKKDIASSNNPNLVRSYDEPIRDFQATEARNELIRDDNTPYNTIPSEQQDIRDSYNLNLNSSATESDDIPPRETPTPEYISPPPPPMGQITRRGRPISELTQAEINILEQALRAKEDAKGRKRTIMEKSIIDQAQRLKDNRRSNEQKQTIARIEAELMQMLENEKK